MKNNKKERVYYVRFTTKRNEGPNQIINSWIITEKTKLNMDTVNGLQEAIAILEERYNGKVLIEYWKELKE